MSKNIIFCFSGSGNCLDIAKNIAKELKDTDIVMMRGEPAVKDVTDARRVGFVFPCYGGGLPGDVEKYVKMLKISPNAYTFGVCSYAGYLGTGLYKIDSIVHLDYWTGISHQCSCIWLFPHFLMLPPVTPSMAQARAERLAKKAAGEILSARRSDRRPPNNPINDVESKGWPKISALKAAKMRINESCIGCGQCASLCPRGNIRVENGRAVIGGNCMQCLSCLQYCPKKAIDLGGISVRRARYHNPNVSAKELSEKVIHID